LHPTESGFPRYYKSLGQFAKPATSSLNPMECAFFLEVASRVDGYPDYARFCADLRQQPTFRTPLMNFTNI
jgi:hypothetical protein